MKILHISTSIHGGAGIAAFRLHKQLRNEGIDSYFLSMNDADKLSFLFSAKKRELNFIEKIGLRIFSNSKDEENKRKLKNKKGVFEIFSFPESDYELHKHPLVKDADLINLHWVAGFLDYPSFFENIKKPIIWTLHDMNPIQGAFHYKEDEVTNKYEFGALDQKIKSIKGHALKNASIKKIVTPSAWLLQESLKSDLLGCYSHILIPNALDENIFKLNDKEFSRQVFNLPQFQKILIFVSDYVSVKRKGFDLLIEALNLISNDENFLIVAIGKLPDQKIKNVHYLGSIKDERLLSLAYSAADAFILASREDNLPNVMLESLMCGIPVLAMPVGGILDVIINEFNGYQASDITAKGLADIITKFKENSDNFIRENIRKDAIEKYSKNIQAEAYINLYKTILNKN